MGYPETCTRRNLRPGPRTGFNHLPLHSTGVRAEPRPGRGRGSKNKNKSALLQDCLGQKESMPIPLDLLVASLEEEIRLVPAFGTKAALLLLACSALLLLFNPDVAGMDSMVYRKASKNRSTMSLSPGRQPSKQAEMQQVL